MSILYKGNLLDTPSTSKVSDSYTTSEGLKIGSSGMQVSIQNFMNIFKRYYLFSSEMKMK